MKTTKETKETWFEKQIGKKMKLVVKKMKTKTNKEAVKTTMKRYFENSFFKARKKKTHGY